jgi:hypothetical protein
MFRSDDPRRHAGVDTVACCDLSKVNAEARCYIASTRQLVGNMSVDAAKASVRVELPV